MHRFHYRSYYHCFSYNFSITFHLVFLKIWLYIANKQTDRKHNTFLVICQTTSRYKHKKLQVCQVAFLWLWLRLYIYMFHKCSYRCTQLRFDIMIRTVTVIHTVIVTIMFKKAYGFSKMPLITLLLLFVLNWLSEIFYLKISKQISQE